MPVTLGILAGVMLAAASPVVTAAPAPVWRVAGTSTGSVAFVDAASVARSGDTVTFRTDTRLREPLSHDRHNLLEQVEAGCESRRWKGKSSFNYREKGQNLTATDTITTVAKPGTVYDAVIDSACTGKFVTGAIPDPARYAAAYFAASGSYREQLEAAARSQASPSPAAEPEL